MTLKQETLFLASLRGDDPHVDDGAIRPVPHLTRLRFCPKSWLLREAFLKVAGVSATPCIGSMADTKYLL